MYLETNREHNKVSEIVTGLVNYRIIDRHNWKTTQNTNG